MMNWSTPTNDSVAVVTVSPRDSFIAALVKNMIVVSLCISINFINGTMVHTFRKHQVFTSSPRYTLFIHLVINDMIQLLLSTLLHIVSYAFYTINVSFCILLLLVSITTTLNTPLNLAGMAAECFIAICLPLRHSQICTIRNTYILIGLVWTAGTVSILPDALILVSTEPVHFFYSRVLCIRDHVFRSGYSLRKRNASHILCLVLVWMVLFFTYFRILFAAKGANKDFRKARNTILLHGFQLLLCMLSYVRPMFENAMQVLVSRKYLSAIRFCSYIISLILPRFISPIIYGLRDQTFRRFTRRYLLCNTSTNVQQEQTSVCLPRLGG